MSDLLYPTEHKIDRILFHSWVVHMLIHNFTDFHKKLIDFDFEGIWNYVLVIFQLGQIV